MLVPGVICPELQPVPCRFAGHSDVLPARSSDNLHTQTSRPSSDSTVSLSFLAGEPPTEGLSTESQSLNSVLSRWVTKP